MKILSATGICMLYEEQDTDCQGKYSSILDYGHEHWSSLSLNGSSRCSFVQPLLLFITSLLGLREITFMTYIVYSHIQADFLRVAMFSNYIRYAFMMGTTEFKI